MRILLIALLTIMILGCGMKPADQSIAKKYCGYEMTNAEVIDVKTRGQEYKYSEKDGEIQSEISSIAQEICGDSIIIEVFLFLSNEKELGIYLFGPKDPALIEKMNCAIINKKYINQVPSRKYILYYDTNDVPLVSGIKSAP